MKENWNLIEKIFAFISGLLRPKHKANFFYTVNGRKKNYSIQNIDNGTINFSFDDPKAKPMIFRGKLGESLLKAFPKSKSQVLKVESFVKAMNGLALIRGDLNKAAAYLELLGPNETTVRAEGLLVAAMVTYMKAFTNTTGRIQLLPGIIPEDLLESHNEIKDVRNKYLSHADLKAEFEIPTNLIIFDEEQFIVEEPMLQKLRIFDISILLPPLIDFVTKHVNGLIEENRKNAESEINGLLRKKH